MIYAGTSKDGENSNNYLLKNAEGEYITYPIKEKEEKNIGIRPTIVIDKEVLYAAGDGTIDNPYIIK